MLVLKEHNLDKKVVDFCGDHYNIYFGGVKRGRKNDVFACIKNELGKNNNGIGCSTHIVHICIQRAVDVYVLLIEVEVLIVKLNKYIDIYTVRVTSLKEICEFGRSDDL